MVDLRKKLPTLEDKSLERYFSEIGRVKLLDRSTETELARRAREEGDEVARAMLVRANLRFVVSLAVRYRDLGLPLADLISEGNLGLLNAAVPDEELDARVDATLKMILTGGPGSLAVSKELIRGIGERSLDENGPYTAEVITRLRMSQEGQEGMNAFLEKRKPGWIDA